jgi:hypothetical protein
MFKDIGNTEVLNKLGFNDTSISQSIKFQLITALRYLINNNVVINDKYGFPSYLREQNNIYYLVNSLSASDNSMSDYYVKNPLVYDKTAFNTIVNQMYIKILPKTITQIFKLKNYTDLEIYLNELPIEVQENILESSLLAERDSINKNITVRRMILQHFKPYFEEDKNNTIVSSLLYQDFDLLRYLPKNTKTWKDDKVKKYSSLIKKVKVLEKKKLTENPYGFYGVYNENSFCIKEVNEAPELIKALTEAKKSIEDNTPIPDDKEITTKQKATLKALSKLSFAELQQKLESTDYLSEYFSTTLPQEELTRILFWGKVDQRLFKKGTVCTFYNNEDLLNFVFNIFKIRPESVKNNDKENLLTLLKPVIGKNEELIRNSIPVEDGFVNRETMVSVISTFISNNNLLPKLQKLVQKTKKIQDYYKTDLSVNELVSIAFWKLPKPEICFYIRKFLEENNLLKYDKNCGTAEKNKKSTK